MIFWHLGATTLAVRYVYRDPGMDLRWVWVGALLPDLIDKPLGSVFFNGHFGAHRLFAHSIVFPVTLFFVVMLMTGRRSTVRKGLIGLVIGALFHLVLDGAWVEPEAFLWPLFGWSFPSTDPSALWPLIREMAADPRIWAAEVFGLCYLGYLWWSHLRDDGGLAGFARHGTIALPNH